MQDITAMSSKRTGFSEKRGTAAFDEAKLGILTGIVPVIRLFGRSGIKSYEDIMQGNFTATLLTFPVAYMQKT